MASGQVMIKLKLIQAAIPDDLEVRRNRGTFCGPRRDEVRGTYLTAVVPERQEDGGRAGVWPAQPVRWDAARLPLQ